MKKYPLIALACVCVISGTFASSCGKNSSTVTQESYNFSEESSKTYGEKIHEFSDTKIPISCDDRFIDEDAANAIADYFYAVQTQDKDLYRKSTVDFYEDYQIEKVYKDKNLDEQSFVKSMHDSIARNTSNDDFKIKSIDVTDYQTGIASGLDEIYQIFDNIKGKDYSSKNISDGARVTLNFSLEGEGGGSLDYSVTDMSIYIIKFDDSWHVIQG